ADSSARYFSARVGNQAPSAQIGTTTASIHSRSPSAWSSLPRSVQGQPRFEHPSAYQSEPATGRAQVQSGWNSAPPRPAAEPARRPPNRSITAKFKVATAADGTWMLDLGSSLDLGCWMLDVRLPPGYSIENSG